MCILGGISDTLGVAFSALRVFALSQRRWPLALIVLLLSLVPVGLNYVSRCRARYASSLADPLLSPSITGSEP